MKSFKLQYEKIGNRYYIGTIPTDNPHHELIKVTQMINPKRISALAEIIKEQKA